MRGPVKSPRSGSSAGAVCLAAALLALFATALPVAGLQVPGGSSATARQVPQGSQASEGERGFLFGRPKGSIALKSGFLFHRAGSDVFTFAEERFTVDRSDFRALSIGIEGSVWFGNRLEGTLTVDASRVTLPSESRDWLEEDGSPIRQNTRLAFGPSVGLGVRYFLFERGESLGNLVWIPRTFNVSVGGGAGVAAYRFEQWGDFVNETNASIFTSNVESKGAVFTPYLTAGASYLLTPRVGLLLEGRYQWGEAELQDQFTGFEPIDLAGLRTTVSLGYSF